MPTSSGLAPVITATGITAGSYADWFAYYVAQFQAIFGADAYLGDDSQDGQWIGVRAQAQTDCCAAAIAVYNSFAPSGAVGVGLSNLVKINGLARLVPTFSTVQVTLTGVAGTTINNGQVIDTNGNTWNLQPMVVIPNAGTILVTATCTQPGAVTAVANTVTGINTPVFGWQAVSNGSNVAVPGAPVETDAALRVRQAASTALPSQSIFEGIVAAIANTPGVTRVKGYENNTDTTNADSIPANTLYFLVEAASSANPAIFNAIFLKITPGIPTEGSITETVTDSNGSTRLLKFDNPTPATITAALDLTPLAGWTTATEALIEAAFVAYINSQPIGSNISFLNAMFACTLVGTPQFGTFTIQATSTLQKNSGMAASGDVTINYNESPVAEPTIDFTVA